MIEHVPVPVKAVTTLAMIEQAFGFSDTYEIDPLPLPEVGFNVSVPPNVNFPPVTLKVCDCLFRVIIAVVETAS